MPLDELQTTTTTTTTMETPTPGSAPSQTRPNTSLLACRLCELSFKTTEEKRQHAKSEWHVYKIRCKVAEPGTVVPPPSSPVLEQDRKSRRTSPPIPHPEEETSDQDSDSDDTSSSEKDTPEFTPTHCLFCPQTSTTLPANMTHMHHAHSFHVPYPSSLAVDLHTLLWYLHMVIFSYRECICCGKRMRTVEAVRQHMLAMGHCRFDVAGEMSEFYRVDELAEQMTEVPSLLDRTLRLPSGKLLAHRSYIDPTPKTKPPSNPPALPSSPSHQTTTPSSQALTKKDTTQEQQQPLPPPLSTQLTQLRASDRMSLLHLPESQQRSLLAAHKKGLDEAKRAERRKRGRVDHVGNKTAIHTNYYKQEVPVYMGG